MDFPATNVGFLEVIVDFLEDFVMFLATFVDFPATDMDFPAAIETFHVDGIRLLRADDRFVLIDWN